MWYKCCLHQFHRTDIQSNGKASQQFRLFPMERLVMLLLSGMMENDSSEFETSAAKQAILLITTWAKFYREKEPGPTLWVTHVSIQDCCLII